MTTKVSDFLTLIPNFLISMAKNVVMWPNWLSCGGVGHLSSHLGETPHKITKYLKFTK